MVGKTLLAKKKERRTPKWKRNATTTDQLYPYRHSLTGRHFMPMWTPIGPEMKRHYYAYKLP